MLSKKEVLKNRSLFSETDKNMAAIFRVLGDVKRYRTFRILAQQPELSVSNLALILDISLPLASQHIKVLAQANLLQKERDGKKVFQKLKHDNPFVQAVIKIIQQSIKSE